MVIKNVTSPFLILSSSAHLLSFEYPNQENKSDKLSSHFVFSKAFATNFRSLNCFSSEFIIVTLNSRYLLF